MVAGLSDLLARSPRRRDLRPVPVSSRRRGMAPRAIRRRRSCRALRARRDQRTGVPRATQRPEEQPVVTDPGGEPSPQTTVPAGEWRRARLREGCSARPTSRMAAATVSGSQGRLRTLRLERRAAEPVSPGRRPACEQRRKGRAAKTEDPGHRLRRLHPGSRRQQGRALRARRAGAFLTRSFPAGWRRGGCR